METCPWWFPMALGLTLVTTGCAPLAVTAVGVGAGAGVSHTMGGYTYKTFTAPAAKVRAAALTALKRMGIKFESSEKTDEGEVLKATAGDREIEIALDIISPNTTRMRTIAKKGALVYDSATSTEIILQTEKALGSG
ncbi:MAG TPA: DUF3568 family protein [Burkholderiales bacterium]|nr:DUF3568 family protein [Burkholderiales bacterium]